MKSTVGVYGTGRIGAGEATLTSGNGHPTVLVGHSRQGMEACRAALEQNWADLISQGVATPENRDAAMALVTVTDDPAALEECEVVFEAVTEDPAVKGEVYRMVGRCCPGDTVIASCTSSLRAEDLAELVPGPERFLIAHPFQPVHLLPLVEVVRHPAAADWAAERVIVLLTELGRKTVVLKKCLPGFLVNRLAQALFRESIYLMEEGVASAEDIDLAVKYAVGMRYASMGLLEYFDDVGFALESAIASNVYPTLCNADRVQPSVLAGLTSGETGRAAGKGLYDWSAKDQEDFLYRKQAPYFEAVRNWDFPSHSG